MCACDVVRILKRADAQRVAPELLGVARTDRTLLCPALEDVGRQGPEPRA